jgi:hypothetical protein
LTRKYPLDPLRRVREEAVDQKVRALSESLRHADAARDEAERTARRQRDFENAIEATAEVERNRLSRGELTVGDLARAAAWSVAKEIDRAEHVRAAEHARGRHAAATAQTAHRQNDLAGAKASAEVVAQHHERWQHARAAERALRDEEDAEQVHLSHLTRRGAP